MKTLLASLILICFMSIAGLSSAQTAAHPLTIESYYKVKWGYADEFIALWKKNHYPLLNKLRQNGDILSINAETPVLHSDEDSRWDFKVTITFKDEHTALDYTIVDPYKKELYPDQESYTKTEQHRFELLISHWDVIVEAVALPQ